MAQWSIEIKAAGSGVAFHRFEQGPPPGASLFAELGDTVVWQNLTDVQVQLQSTNPPGSALDQTIGPGQSSSGLFVVIESVAYECVLPQQGHRIEVVSPLTFRAPTGDAAVALAQTPQMPSNRRSRTRKHGRGRGAK